MNGQRHGILLRCLFVEREFVALVADDDDVRLYQAIRASC